jgi:sodium-dependent dicarboxylate transporter 2/3/5
LTEISAESPESQPDWLRFPWDRVGLVLGPAAMVAWLVFGSADISPEAHRLSGVLLLVIVWWLTEPIPIPATGLLGVALAVVIGAIPTPDTAGGRMEPVRIALAPFGNPTLFFLLGGMFIGRAMSRHGLDRRIALGLLGTRGAVTSPTALMCAVALSVCIMSMWISNTAATAMIYPVTLGIIAVLAASLNVAGQDFSRGSFATSLLLLTAYASSVGGVATPIGTTTNVVAMGYFRQEQFFGRSIDFGRWSIVGLPMSLALVIVLVVWMRVLAPPGRLDLAAVRRYLHEQRSKLGPWSPGERNTLLVFVTVVMLWIAPSLLSLVGATSTTEWLHRHLPEEIVALLAPVMLFLLPVDWRRRKFSLEASDFSAIDWGTLMLFGSGLALGDLMVRTGLVGAIADGVFNWLETDDVWTITAAAIVGGIVLSEFTSNAAAATTLIPVVFAIARQAGVDPMPPLMGVTFAASFGSALPVSTPPNAIVYGSGMIPARRMIAAGVGFDLLCGLVVWLVLRVAFSLGWSPFIAS